MCNFARSFLKQEQMWTLIGLTLVFEKAMQNYWIFFLFFYLEQKNFINGLKKFFIHHNLLIF